MVISERKLEENEAKIDNILHKIISASKQIKAICSQIKEHTSGEVLTEKVRRISLLNELISNLANFADEIEIKDETLTTELEEDITQGLDKAIKGIIQTENFLD